jgi:Cu(I)/Ag(I) efflux system protein CusF
LNMKQRTFLTGLLALTLPAVAGQHLTDAQVRKVDKEGAKITLKHGEIKNLDMPPMTMVFGVKDKAALDKLKAGDKVRFKAVNEAGKYTVTEIQVVQ